MHTIHGRALAFATGIKMSRPEFTVVVVTGDGDGAAIGGNHLIHACRRNIDLTCILFNNQVYGMTGGQISPQADMGRPGDHGAVRPGRGVVRPVPADPGRRGDVRRPRHRRRHPPVAGHDQAGHRASGVLVHRGGGALSHGIRQAERHRGACSPCSTTRRRGRWRSRRPGLSPAELQGKIVTGVLHRDTTRPEFQRTYAALIARAQAERQRRPRQSRRAESTSAGRTGLRQ